ncbi:MAG: polymerase [Thermomicrobiales bacterium]|jgi:DNA polymerase|nr:polymerase [Thermomicrobiales bacterium]
MAWAFDDEEPQIWYPDHAWEFLHPYVDCDRGVGEECPECDARDAMMYRIMSHIVDGGEIRAWNAEFERAIWREIMHKRYGFINPQLEQWVDSAAEAAAMALPRSLDLACKVTRVPAQKDNEGYSLMMRMTKPKRRKKGAPQGPPEWIYDREKIERLGSYCAQDVRAEKSIVKVLRRLTPIEREHYLEVCRQNDAGITVDVELVRAMRRVADEGLERANAALEELTGGEVSEVTNHQRLREWVNSRGVETTSVAKKVIRELLESDLADDVRGALELRRDAGKSSLAKLDSLLECLCSDGKIRGMLVFHGASTGRETAKLVQPHNFPRGEIPDPPGWKGAPYIETFIPAVLRESYDEIDLDFHPINVVSSMLRSTLVAGPGNELIAADFSGIEARVVNWIAGQDDMLENFRALDGGDKTRDPYVINAMRYYKLPFEQVKKIPHRQTGKFQELGCGFGMGAKTGMVQAKDIYQLVITEAEAKALVDNYRATHPKVKQFWYDIDDAALQAVAHPGTTVVFGPLKNLIFTKRGAYLYLILPSKRPLVYAQPKIIDRMTPWGEMRSAVQIRAVHPKSKQWWEQDMYGGIWTENVVQAIARDIMAEAKLRARAAGYPTILTVHDELVAEVPAGFGDVKEFEQILTRLPGWATGLPIAAEGWRGHRYRK